MSKYIGKRIVPKHCGEWNRDIPYEMLSIVLHTESGESYISRCEVPAGMDLMDGRYWAVCSRFSQQIKDMETHLQETESRMNTNLSETETRMAEDLHSTKASMSEELAQTEQRVTKQTDDASAKVDESMLVLSNAVDQMQKRLDANVTASTKPQADYAAEIVDARVDSHGNEYPSLGSRLRNQENVFLYRNMVGLFLFRTTGQVVTAHESYKGNCTGKITYLQSLGSIQIEKKNLVFDNVYIATIAFYDINGQFLAGFNQESDFIMDEMFATFPAKVVPEGAYSFAVSLKAAGTSVWFRYSNADWYEIAATMDSKLEEKEDEHRSRVAALQLQASCDISCSKNLLNQDSPFVDKGHFLGGNGDIRDNEQYAISNYIPVAPGVEYSYTAGTGGAYCALYDAQFHFLESFKGPTNMVIPERGCYVRLSYQYPSSTAMFLEKNNGPSMYEAYCSLYEMYQMVYQNNIDVTSKLALKLDKKFTKNLFDKNAEAIIRERYLGSQGGIGTNQMYFISDYIEVEPGETYFPHRFGAGGAYHCVYAKDKRTVVLAFKDSAVTIPEDGRYVRLSGLSSRMDEQQFEKGTAFTGYEPYSEYQPVLALSEAIEELARKVDDPEPLKNKLDRQMGKNLFDCHSEDNIVGKFLGSNGALNENEAYYVSHYIPVSAGETYCLHDFGAGGAYHCIYADDKTTLISSFKSDVVTIPENGAYIRVSGRTATLTSQQIEKGEEFTGYEEYTEYSPCYENTKLIRKLESDVSDVLGRELKVVLPQTLYFCAGVPLSIYYENVLYKSYTDAADLYCSKAQPYSRLMNFIFDTPEAGEAEMSIYKALKKASSQKFQYEVVDPKQLEGRTIRMLFVGDSFTDIGSYVTETRKLLAGNGAEVELIGTCGSSKFKAEGLSGGSLSNTFLTSSAGVGRIVQVTGVNVPPNTGYPGRVYQDDKGNQWTIRGSKIDENGNGKMVVTKFAATEASFEDFPEQGTLTKVSTGGEGDATIHYQGIKPAYHNPFINPESGELDILYYLKEWEFEAPDVVIFQFTWNDAGPWATNFSTLVSNFKRAVDHVHASLPDTKIILSIEPFGSVFSGRDWNGKKYTVLNLVIQLCELFEGKEYEGYCKIAPSYACVDLMNGYSTMKVTPNVRYPDQQEISAGDGVHPGTGMLQIADCLYPVITKLLVE